MTSSQDGFTSIIDVLAYQLAEQPNRRSYTLLDEHLAEVDSLTYAQLDLRARKIAARLVSYPRGARVLIMVPNGIDFLVAFFGCLHAGVVAVPLPSPEAAQLKQSVPRLRGVADDAEPVAVISARANAESVSLACGEITALAEIDYVVLGRDEDTEPLAELRPVAVTEPAYLQYTSGSTSTPKGVMITQVNLLRQSEILHEAWESDPEAVSVNWMPYSHDFGLLDGLIQPLYVGTPSFLMAPMTFLKSPASWLRAISVFGATHSSAPVFAFDYCVKRVTDRQLEGLDLSRWRSAVIGAERVHAGTLSSFAERFASVGLREDTVRPGFGLAEYTLMATCRPSTRRTTVLPARVPVSDAPGSYVPPSPLVGCGFPLAGTKVRIVNPDTGVACPDATVGEVWLSGPSVAAGYWHRPVETAETFQASIADDGPDGDVFMRTGDLGLMHDGELFITGRLKELIIVQGANRYPEDVELAVAGVAPRFGGLRGAAFALDVDGTERLVVVHETSTRSITPEEVDELAGAARRAVVEQCGVDLYALALVRRGGIPKTTSGKVQRRACREAYLTGTLAAIGEWRNRVGEAAEAPATVDDRPDRADLRAWLVTTVAELGEVDPGTIDTAEPLARYGLTSVAAAHLASELAEVLGTPVDASVIYEYPTIDALIERLAGGSPAESLPVAEKARMSESRPVVSAEPRPGTRDTAVGVDTGFEKDTAVEPVAIVGMGLRLPGGVDGPEAFWRLLRDGRDVVTEVSADRWRAEEFFDADLQAPGRTISRWGGFLADVDKFDAAFFGISRREAIRMDPQQRLLLEVTQQALDDAGLPRDTLRGSNTGVFGGIGHSEYSLLNHAHPELADSYTATGSFPAIAANRISYIYDLRGPSFTVDAVCSSALLALHLGVQALQRQECDRAIVCGANLTLTPDLFVWFSKLGVMSPDGRCRAFDAAGNGIVFGEGVISLVLRPLSAALEDGDQIYAVIRGSAAMQEGRTNGMTSPSREAQEALLRRAYSAAGVSPRDVHYVETHGTGTQVGDPIEAHALGSVLGADRRADRPCYLGSVKSNLGHLGMVGGLAGLAKAALALRYRQLPASLHFRKENPALGLAARNLAVVDRLMPWPAQERGLAGATSLSFGGTNVHVVLEEAPATRKQAGVLAGGEPHLLALSAHDDQALRQLATRYARLATEHTAPSLSDLCYTAAVRRSHYAHRLAVLADSADELAETLAAFAEGRQAPQATHGRSQSNSIPDVVFVFSGRGPQWAGMGRRLLQLNPAFRAELLECDRSMRPHLGVSVVELLSADDLAAAQGYWQPVLFALQAAFAAAWRSLGVRPQAVVGHSVGEIAAAYVSGALSMADAVRVVCARQRAIAETAVAGLMVVANASAEMIGTLLTGVPGVSLAAVNSAHSVVVSGDERHMGEIVERLAREGIEHRIIDVGFPSHSQLMRPIATKLAANLCGLRPRSTAVPMYSTVRGAMADGPEFGAAYWADNLCEPVRFGDVVERLGRQAGASTFIEIGPHPVLLTALEEQADDTGRRIIALASTRRDAEIETWLASIGRIYTLGVPVRWDLVYLTGNLVPAPTQMWQRERFWLTDETSAAAITAVNPAVNRAVYLAVNPAEPRSWNIPLDDPDTLVLRQHRAQAGALIPAAAYPVLAIRAAKAVFGDEPTVLADLVIDRPRLIAEDDAGALRMTLAPDGTLLFEDNLDPQTGSTPLARATVRRFDPQEATSAVAEPISSSSGLVEEITGAVHDQLMWARGARYGSAFRGLIKVRRRDGSASGSVRATQAGSGWAATAVVLDRCFQLAYHALPGNHGLSEMMPSGIRRIRIHRPLTQGDLLVRARLAEVRPGEAAEVDLEVRTESGDLAVDITGLQLRAVPGHLPGTNGYLPDWRAVQALAGTEPPAGTWLVCTDGATGDEAAAELTARGATVLLVRKAEKLGQLPEGWALPPTREAFTALAEQVTGSVAGIVYAWGVDRPAESDPATAARELATEVTPLLGGWSEAVLPRLYLVGRGGCVLPGDRADGTGGLVHSPLAALARTVRVEYPDSRCTVVDLDPAQPQIAPLADLFCSAVPEDIIAVRSGRWYAQRLIPAKFTAAADGARQDEAPDSHVGITCLVTGGLGGLGLLVADRLLGNGVRRVALTGRHDPTPAVAARLDELDPTSDRIIVCPCDVTDADQVRELLDELDRSGPPVRGVVHAAAVLDDGVSSALTAERIAAVFDPKALGAWHLHTLTANRKLDFFVLFSSIASILGSPGQANYAAANAFLDALAHHRRARGLPALSINWGPWQDSDIGERGTRHWADRGVAPLSSSDGLKAFDALLHADIPQAAVFGYLSDTVNIGSTSPPVPVPGPQRLEDGAALSEWLLGQVAEVLRADPARLDTEDPFQEIGVDSLMALELRNRFEAHLGVKLSATALWRYPSVSALAKHLAERISLTASSREES